MRRWALPQLVSPLLLSFSVLVVAPVLLLAAPRLGDAGVAVAAVALVAAAVVGSLIVLGPQTAPPVTLSPGARSRFGAEHQHRRGAFRRQEAPDTPGRPRQPRAPAASGRLAAAL